MKSVLKADAEIAASIITSPIVRDCDTCENVCRARPYKLTLLFHSQVIMSLTSTDR